MIVRADPDLALSAMLTEMAAVLLVSGVTASEFIRVASASFVDAASRQARLRNGRVNQSAVAAMTGLSRVEVSRLVTERAQKSGSVRKHGHRALRVVEGWCTDPDFTTRQGRPMVLALKDGPHSFPELVRRFSGDITARALLGELKRLHLAEDLNNKVRLVGNTRKFAQTRTTKDLSNAFLSALSEMARPQTGRRRITSRQLVVRVPGELAHKLLKRRTEDSLQAFFRTVEAAATGVSMPRVSRSATKDKRTSINVIVTESS